MANIIVDLALYAGGYVLFLLLRRLLRNQSVSFGADATAADYIDRADDTRAYAAAAPVGGGRATRGMPSRYAGGAQRRRRVIQPTSTYAAPAPASDPAPAPTNSFVAAYAATHAPAAPAAPTYVDDGYSDPPPPPYFVPVPTTTTTSTTTNNAAAAYTSAASPGTGSPGSSPSKTGTFTPAPPRQRVGTSRHTCHVIC